MINVVGTTTIVTEPFNGTLANGTLTISMPESFIYTPASGVPTVVAAFSTKYSIVNGVVVDTDGVTPVSMELVPTSSSPNTHSKTGLYYKARYEFTSSSTPLLDFWSLPDSQTSPVEIADVTRIAQPGDTTAVLGMYGPGTVLDHEVPVFTGTTGNYVIGSGQILNTVTATVSSTTSTSIASISTSTYAGAKLVIHGHDTVTAERQISELLVVSDGTTASILEVSTVYTGSAALGTFSAAVSSGDIVISVTNASTDSTDYSVQESLITL